MSSKRRPRPNILPTPVQTSHDAELPGVAAPYCDTYRYHVAENNIVTFYFARGINWYVGVAMPIELAVKLHQQLGMTLADAIRDNCGKTAPLLGDVK